MITQGRSDPLYEQVCEYVRGEGRISALNIQARFRVGYPRAKNMVLAMEADKISSLPNKGGVRHYIGG